MTHIVAGYPTLKASEELAALMLESEVNYLEIQIPFSDPIADGATIMEANQKALEEGTTPEDCLQLLKRLKQKFETPILLMTYFNIPFRYGLKAFCKRAKEYGTYGLIIPDMPIDEEASEHYLSLCKKYSLHPIQVISPITPERRLRKIGKIASGFVYCVARTGTTGESQRLNTHLDAYLTRVRKYISTPLALGFGISSRKQIQTALKKADIAVIGSKIINMIQEKNGMKKIEKFIMSI